MASLEIQRVTKVFDKHTAVNDISLQVGDGEFLVLLGPSGCGKSTLLRIIAGLEIPTYGDILIGDRVATRLAPKDRNIAMVFQNYALYPHLTIFENIAFPLHVNGQRGAKVEEKVKWAASLVGIENLLTRKPRQLSGGERQRTALARSLVRDPAVFLLDEPLSNLDAKLRHSAREELRSFQERLSVTTVYVTHDQVEAMGLGDRIAVLEGGRVRQIGVPEDIYENPADTFVATFIGSPPMNLLDHGDHILGFRPERLMPREYFGGEQELMTVPLRVSRIEYLGGDRLVYATTEAPLPSGKVIARLPQTLDTLPADGSLAQFAVRQSDIRLFDPRTGMALPNLPPTVPRIQVGGRNG